jgi:hypothetical protein
MNASQERMIAEKDAWLSETRAWRKEMKSNWEAMEACLESMEIQSESKHQAIPKEEAAMKTVKSTEEVAWGHASSHKVPWSAKEMDPGRWWILEEVGRHMQKGLLQCGSSTA